MNSEKSKKKTIFQTKYLFVYIKEKKMNYNKMKLKEKLYKFMFYLDFELF